MFHVKRTLRTPAHHHAITTGYSQRDHGWHPIKTLPSIAADPGVAPRHSSRRKATLALARCRPHPSPTAPSPLAINPPSPRRPAERPPPRPGEENRVSLYLHIGISPFAPRQGQRQLAPRTRPCPRDPLVATGPSSGKVHYRLLGGPRDEASWPRSKAAFALGSVPYGQTRTLRKFHHRAASGASGTRTGQHPWDSLAPLSTAPCTVGITTPL